MLVTTQCASYCRYCTRSRIVGDPGQTFSRQEFEMQIEYLKRSPQVRDVLLSGGDPLTLAPKLLEELLGRLREIEHIEIIRIGSRVPVFLPMRVDDELTAMLEKYHPLWLNIHVNHPNEITSELAQACDRLSKAGGDYIYGKKHLREIDRRIRYLIKRLDASEVVDPAAPRDEDQAGQVFFGATVDVVGADGAPRTVSIVGVDEIDTARGYISSVSPMARALIKAREGDTVTLQTPAGAEELEIAAVRYVPLATGRWTDGGRG